VKKRIITIIILILFIFFIYLLENFLSTRVKDLTTIKYTCYLYQNDDCKNKDNTEHLNLYYNENQNNIIDKIYNYQESDSDTKNEIITDSKLVQREANLLNKDMYYLANQIKDKTVTNLDRAHDYYPSKYKRDNTAVKILAVSDSYGIGAGLHNNNDSWPGVLELNLLKEGINITVDKFVKNGANFPDYLEMLSEKNIKLLDPDIIVISIFKNDLDPLGFIEQPYYVRCLTKGIGGEYINNIAKSKIPNLYSLVLSRICDPKKLKSKYYDINKNKNQNYKNITDDPSADWFKSTMKEIIKNASGRPIIIQPLFSNPDESFDSIKDYINYLKTIGYIVPEFDVLKVRKYASKLDNKIFSLYPIDYHYSRVYNNHLTDITKKAIKEYLAKNKYNNLYNIDLSNTPTIINTTPLFLKHNNNLLLQYEKPENPNIVNQLSAELKRAGTKVGDILDEVLCTKNNRASVKVYFNQIKHYNNKLTVYLKTSQRPIALSAIYYSPDGEELNTDIKIIKPGDLVAYTADKKIVGLIFGAPKSGCTQDSLWSMPSFIAKLTYN
jgi:hypothetical protein